MIWHIDIIYCEIIARASLVNIHHHIITNFFHVMRTFKIHSLSNFQIYNTVLLTIFTMLSIMSPEFIYHIIGYFSNHLHPYQPPPFTLCSGNHQSVLSLYDFIDQFFFFFF